MPRLFQAAGALVDRIKVNTLTRERRDGRAVWIKRRRRTAGPLLAVADRFFRLAGNPVRTIADPARWQRWEVTCFDRLHAAAFHAFAVGADAVGADELPGRSLSEHLTAGTLSAEMLGAAGRELRRAHERSCEFFHAAWSHGDPHSGNFLFDPAGGRARLIDFEVQHHAALPAGERHADDLLVFLQDLVGRTSGERWLPEAQAFLDGYARPEIVRILREKLIVPRGLARLWWSVRTTYLAHAELVRRIDELRATLA